MTSSPRPPRRAPSRDPYGLLPKGTPIAAILATIGLVLVLAVSLTIFTGDLPFGIGVGGGGGGNGEPGASGQPVAARTPTPSNVVVVPSPEAPGITVLGTLVYAKDGNIWIQKDGDATQLTDSGSDSMPSFNEDGSSVYFVRTRPVQGRWSVNGVVKPYAMDVPSLMEIPVGGGSAKKVYDGLVDPAGSLKWMGFIQAPDVSPDGSTIAMTTDMPDPTRSDVTLKLLNLKNGKIKDLGLPQRPPLGHQDAAWRPDGKRIAYVYNDRDGAKGAPRIYLYSLDNGKTKAMTGPGYLHPSWSPDGKYIAATKTSQFGTDVVVLDAATGSELVRITNDGNSWGPAWSPAGNQIAFLHVMGQVVDLRMVQLDGSAPTWTVSEAVDLTSAAGLDGVSVPDWWVDPTERPVATPVPEASASTAP
jgi:Tol biopolymer transport system component